MTKLNNYHHWRAAVRRAYPTCTVHWDGGQEICEALVEREGGPVGFYEAQRPDLTLRCVGVGAWDGEEGYVVEGK